MDEVGALNIPDIRTGGHISSAETTFITAVDGRIERFFLSQ